MAITLGEYLIKLLERFDVDHVFGIPGVHTAELYRGLTNSPIRHVTPRHEQGASFAADGYARMSGKPGVCLLITGPGLTNALTGGRSPEAAAGNAGGAEPAAPTTTAPTTTD